MITSTIKKGLTAVLACFALTATAGAIHVTTTGNDENIGTAEAPLLTIHKAVEICQPGDTIWVHGGRYVISERIKIPEKATTAERRCYLWAAGDGEVIIDGSGMHHTTEAEFKMGRCIYVNHLANYWHFKGLTLCNAEDNGMKVEGSYNIIEQCVFHDNNDTGLQIGMYKDFKIEETKSLPISGQPEFNPGYTYCRGNKVINCDSYNNYDSRSYNGTDDGGDADGFACKLFPGPGTEFHGCRAWTNSDDNWDLYMVYHPVVIDHCWAWHAGYTPSGSEGKNGNGFKLGGGGSAGGAAFDQSVGAHVVTNCVAFGNLHKGFDQNNAYEGMYIFNCTAWGNEYNYRFPTLFMYGGMMIRNCIGWGATAEKSGVKVGNHEFLSPDKEGYQDPDTDFNSWTTLDGCSPIKEGYKEGKTQIVTKDYSSEFLSLSVADFLAPREADGSLPNNNFARLKPGSIMKDKGTPIVGFTPKRHLSLEEATAKGLELITADDIYINYNDEAPDFGAFELDGVPNNFVVPEKIELTCKTANSSQEVVGGEPIADIVYEWNEVGTTAKVENLAEGLTYKVEGQQLTISGTPQTGCTFTVTVSGNSAEGVKDVTTSGIITLVLPSRVLTGDWYHFQDSINLLPADLQGVLEIINGDGGNTVIDPDKEETSSGYSKGAVCLAQSNGGLKMNFDNGVLKYFLNVYFTGGRTFEIKTTMADGSTKTTTTQKYSKGSYQMNILELAGLTSDEDRIRVRSITFAQKGANGGARIYDMYAAVYTGTPAGIISTNADAKATETRKVIKNGQVIIVKNGQQYNTKGQKAFYGN